MPQVPNAGSYFNANPASSGGNGLPNAIANRGASSYFNKGGIGSSKPTSGNGALPTLGSGGISGNNPT